VIYPLDSWDNLKDGYTFGVSTHYNSFHLGIDKFADEWTKIYAPDNGEILAKLWGTQGGYTIHYRDAKGNFWRFLHLVHFGSLWGKVNEGDIIGYVGNTGSLGGSPHLHTDISKKKLKLNDINNFIDPQIYIKENLMKFPPDSVVWNKKDGEFYWTKNEGYLKIKKDRLVFASLLKKGDAISIDEDISNQVIGTF